MEVHASSKNQTFFIMFMYYLTSKTENSNVLVFSGRLFYCKKISFLLAKTSVQSAFISADSYFNPALKTSENLWFSVFESYRKRPVA